MSYATNVLSRDGLVSHWNLDGGLETFTGTGPSPTQISESPPHLNSFTVIFSGVTETLNFTGAFAPFYENSRTPLLGSEISVLYEELGKTRGNWRANTGIIPPFKARAQASPKSLDQTVEVEDHLAVTWSGTKIQIYKNGILQSEGTSGQQDIAQVANYFFVRGEQEDSFFFRNFSGKIRRLSVYGRVLSSNEISEDFVALTTIDGEPIPDLLLVSSSISPGGPYQTNDTITISASYQDGVEEDYQDILFQLVTWDNLFNETVVYSGAVTPDENGGASKSFVVTINQNYFYRISGRDLVTTVSYGSRTTTNFVVAPPTPTVSFMDQVMTGVDIGDRTFLQDGDQIQIDATYINGNVSTYQDVLFEMYIGSLNTSDQSITYELFDSESVAPDINRHCRAYFSIETHEWAYWKITGGDEDNTITFGSPEETGFVSRPPNIQFGSINVSPGPFQEGDVIAFETVYQDGYPQFYERVTFDIFIIKDDGLSITHPTKKVQTVQSSAISFGNPSASGSIDSLEYGSYWYRITGGDTILTLQVGSPETTGFTVAPDPLLLVQPTVLQAGPYTEGNPLTISSGYIGGEYRSYTNLLFELVEVGVGDVETVIDSISIPVDSEGLAQTTFILTIRDSQYYRVSGGDGADTVTYGSLGTTPLVVTEAEEIGSDGVVSNRENLYDYTPVVGEVITETSFYEGEADAGGLWNVTNRTTPLAEDGATVLIPHSLLSVEKVYEFVMDGNGGINFTAPLDPGEKIALTSVSLEAYLPGNVSSTPDVFFPWILTHGHRWHSKYVDKQWISETGAVTSEQGRGIWFWFNGTEVVDATYGHLRKRKRNYNASDGPYTSPTQGPGYTGLTGDQVTVKLRYKTTTSNVRLERDGIYNSDGSINVATESVNLRWFGARGNQEADPFWGPLLPSYKKNVAPAISWACTLAGKIALAREQASIPTPWVNVHIPGKAVATLEVDTEENYYPDWETYHEDIPDTSKYTNGWAHEDTSVQVIRLTGGYTYDYFGPINRPNWVRIKGDGGVINVQETDDLDNTFDVAMPDPTGITRLRVPDNAFDNMYGMTVLSSNTYWYTPVDCWYGLSAYFNDISHKNGALNVGISDIVLDGNWLNNRGMLPPKWGGPLRYKDAPDDDVMVPPVPDLDNYYRNAPTCTGISSSQHGGKVVGKRVINGGEEPDTWTPTTDHWHNLGNISWMSTCYVSGQNGRVLQTGGCMVGDVPYNHALYGTSGEWEHITHIGPHWSSIILTVGTIHKYTSRWHLTNPLHHLPSSGIADSKRNLTCINYRGDKRAYDIQDRLGLNCEWYDPNTLAATGQITPYGLQETNFTIHYIDARDSYKPLVASSGPYALLSGAGESAIVGMVGTGLNMHGESAENKAIVLGLGELFYLNANYTNGEESTYPKIAKEFKLKNIRQIGGVSGSWMRGAMWEHPEFEGLDSDETETSHTSNSAASLEFSWESFEHGDPTALVEPMVHEVSNVNPKNSSGGIAGNQLFIVMPQRTTGIKRVYKIRNSAFLIPEGRFITGNDINGIYTINGLSAKQRVDFVDTIINLNTSYLNTTTAFESSVSKRQFNAALSLCTFQGIVDNAGRATESSGTVTLNNSHSGSYIDIQTTMWWKPQESPGDAGYDVMDSSGGNLTFFTGTGASKVSSHEWRLGAGANSGFWRDPILRVHFLGNTVQNGDTLNWSSSVRPPPVPDDFEDVVAPASPSTLTAIWNGTNILVTTSVVYEADLAGYRFFRRTQGSTEWGSPVQSGTSLSYLDLTTTSETTYEYAVESYDEVPNYSDKTISNALEHPAPPPTGSDEMGIIPLPNLTRIATSNTGVSADSIRVVDVSSQVPAGTTAVLLELHNGATGERFVKVYDSSSAEIASIKVRRAGQTIGVAPVEGGNIRISTSDIGSSVFSYRIVGAIKEDQFLRTTTGVPVNVTPTVKNAWTSVDVGSHLEGIPPPRMVWISFYNAANPVKLTGARHPDSTGGTQMATREPGFSVSHMVLCNSGGFISVNVPTGIEVRLHAGIDGDPDTFVPLSTIGSPSATAGADGAGYIPYDIASLGIPSTATGVILNTGYVVAAGPGDYYFDYKQTTGGYATGWSQISYHVNRWLPITSSGILWLRRNGSQTLEILGYTKNT